MSEAELIWHPLFPPSEDDDDSDATPPDIQEIHVQRKENGRLFTAPRTFLPNELMSIAALYTEFGGGEYHLLGRNHLKQIKARRVIAIPGPSKPMFDDGLPVGQKAPPPATPVNPMAAMMGASPEGGFMGLIMMMMQNMMQQASQAAERQTQMMLAMMQAASSGSQAQVAAMQENMRAQAERDQRDKQAQIELMLKLTEARQSGNSSGSEESFFKGVEFMRHFSTQQIEQMKLAASGKKDSDFDLEGLLGTALEALQGFQAFRGMAVGQPPAVSPTEVIQ